jgi:hypothetical protein
MKGEDQGEEDFETAIIQGLPFRFDRGTTDGVLADQTGLPDSSTDLSARAVPTHPGDSDECVCP